MQEETASKVMAADRPYVEFYDFYIVSPEYFGFHQTSISFRFTHQKLVCSYTLSMPATCSVYFNLPDLITLIIFGEEYEV
jgi:hypothetical protein